MNTKKNFFSRVLVILMAAMLMVTMIPCMAFAEEADVSTPALIATADVCPVTVTAGDKALTATATSETVTDAYLGTAKVYEVTVPAGVEEATISGYVNDTTKNTFIAYNYTTTGEFINSPVTYENNAQTGVTSVTVKVDDDFYYLGTKSADKDGVPDMIYVQTPYDSSWTSSLVCVIKFTYEKSVIDAKAVAGAAEAAGAASSTKAKKSVKVTYKPDTKTQSYIDNMEALGYTVKYRFYRSTKKASSYKAMLTKSSKTYTNTSGKAGTRYYYKTQIRVYDKDGKLVANTALKNCKYASRVFD